MADGFNALVDWVAEMVVSICDGFVDSVLRPLADCWLSYCQGLLYAIGLMQADMDSLGYVTASSEAAMVEAFYGDFYWLAFGVAAIITAIALYLTASASFMGFLVSVAISFALSYVIQSVFATDTEVSDGTPMALGACQDMYGEDNQTALLAMADEIDYGPSADDNSSDAADWRSIFLITSMAAGVFASHVAIASVVEAGVSGLLYKVGVLGIVAGLIAAGLSFASVFDIDDNVALMFTGFWLGIFSIVTSAYGMYTASESFVRYVGIASILIGGLSLTLCVAGTVYED